LGASILIMEYHSVRMTALCLRVAALALVLATAMLLPATAAAQGQDEPPAGPKILLLFDASGSMNSDSGNGTSKLQAAKTAATALLEELPESTQLGLRLFGGTLPSRPIARACRDSSLVLPIGPLAREETRDKLESFKARGRTPIAYALEQAAKDLGTEGPRTIILVSDGKDTCPPPAPCEVAEQISRGGVDVRIQAIGFNVDRSARRQLECVAQAGGGVYRDAEDADTLREELRILSTRALRQYTVRGKPIKGGPSARKATLTAPGRYVDRLLPDSERWYAVDLRRGESVKAGASLIPPTREIADNTDLAEMELDVVTPSFDIPQIQNSYASSTPFEIRGLVGGIGVVSRPVGVGAQAAPDAPFSKPGRYYLKLKLNDSDDKTLFDATGGRPYEVELAVEVLGRKGGTTPPPEEGSSSPADALPGDTVSARTEPPAPALLGLVGGGLAALGLGGGLAVRRRRGAA